MKPHKLPNLNEKAKCQRLMATTVSLVVDKLIDDDDEEEEDCPVFRHV